MNWNCCNYRCCSELFWVCICSKVVMFTNWVYLVFLWFQLWIHWCHVYRRLLYPKPSRSSRRKMKIPNPLNLDGSHQIRWRPNSSGPRHLSDICWLKLQFVFVIFRCIYRVTIQVSFCLGHFHLSMPGLVCFHMHRRIQGPISKMWWRTARIMVWSRS